jgi:hypothetical protein
MIDKTKSRLPAIVPKAQPLEVDIIDRETRQAVFADADDALKVLGYSKLTSNKLHALSKIGVAVHGAGVVATQHGGAYVSQSRLMESIELLAGIADKLSRANVKRMTQPKHIEKVVMVTKALGDLAGQLTRSHQMVLESSGVKNPIIPSGPPAPAPVTPFLPGEKIIPNQNVLVQSGATVHVHSAPETPKP